MRILLTLVVASLGIAGVNVAGSDQLTALQRDKRLHKPITLSAARIPVGQLCEELNLQTGVRIEADLRDGAADPDVAVFVTTLPASVLMEALWSLLSHRNAEWRWRTEVRPGGPSYILQQPLRARQFPKNLRQEVQNLFEDQAEALTQASRMEGAEREAFLDRFAKQRFPEDAGLGARLAESERMLDGMNLFSEALPHETRLQVLRGQAQFLRVTVADLSARARSFVRSQWEAAKPFSIDQRTGERVPTPEPTFVTFEVSRAGSGEGPSLFIHMEGMGGYGYAGGVPVKREVLRKLKEKWTLAGDRDLTVISDRDIKASEEVSATILAAPNLSGRLEQVAKGAAVPILMRLPQPASSTNRRDPGDPVGEKLEDYLKTLSGLPFSNLIKTRRGVVLMQGPAWFHEVGDFAPWNVRRNLRTEARESAALSVKTLSAAAQKLPELQLRQLAGEFPIFSNVARWRDLFATLGERPLIRAQMESSRGTPVLDVLKGLDLQSTSRKELDLDNQLAAYLRVENGIRRQMKTLEFVVTRVDGSLLHRVIWTLGTTPAPSLKN